MKKKLSLVLIVLLGVLLLSGCSNDSDSLSDEAAITAVVEDFENDLNILATAASSSDEYKGVDAGWDDDKNFIFEFSGVETNISGLNDFKKGFYLVKSSMKIDYFDLDIMSPISFSNNKATVVAYLLDSAPTAMSNGLEHKVIVNLEKTSNEWYVKNFKIEIENEEVISDDFATIYNDKINLRYPKGLAWADLNTGSISDLNSDFYDQKGLKLSSNYYTPTKEYEFIGSYPKYSTLLVDSGTKSGIESISDLATKINNEEAFKSEIKILSENVLQSLYSDNDLEINVSIDNFDYKPINVDEDNEEIICTINSSIDVDVSSNDLGETSATFNIDYNIKILYKLDGDILYLASYAAPELYYNDELAEDLINSFEVIEK